MLAIDDQLKKAVTEYYEWQGDKKAKPVRFVVNKMPGKYKMLLVRFTDEQGNKMSSLMEYQEWKDGHWDVTEIFVSERADEDRLVKGFEESEEYF